MKPEFSKYAFWVAVATGMVCVLVLATLTFQSLFRLFGTQPENEKAIPVAAESASPAETVKSVFGAGEHSYVNPAPVLVPATSADPDKIAKQRKQSRIAALGALQQELEFGMPEVREKYEKQRKAIIEAAKQKLLKQESTSGVPKEALQNSNPMPF